MNVEELRINGKRLKYTLERMAEIGATPEKGVQRLTLSDEDQKARNIFVKWLDEIGCEVTIDEMGNIFGKRAGKNNSLPPVMSGSHMDSQPKGGRFDGVLGVMGALEVLRTLEENHIETLRPIVIVNWTNEEGSRFPPAMSSSGVWVGMLKRNWVYSQTDTNGKRFVDELERIGYRGKTPARHYPIHAYYEYHIEQGPVLEKVRKSIGVPKGVLCLHWYDIYVEGDANQVGPTPMEGRHDALCATAEMILKVNDLPNNMGGGLVATVGEIHNYPNSRNSIPGKVYFTVDIRSWDDQKALDAWDHLHDDLKEIANNRGCRIHTDVKWRVEHSPFDEHLVKRVLNTANELDYTSHCMVSGAGHDASYISKIAPASMIFVPSIGGRSHVEEENTTWDDCEAGANVLLHCILKSVNEVD